MKKLLCALCALCALALLAGLLAGCGAKADPKDAVETTTAAGPEISLPEFPTATNPPANGNETQPPSPGEWNFGEGTVFTEQWPDNEFTRQVPKPGFELSAIGVTTAEGFVAMFVNVEPQQLRDYVKDLQNAGFTKDAETTDESVVGMYVFTYKAGSSRGYTVEVVSSFVVNTITISKAG